MPLLEISVVPVGTSDSSFSSYVNNAVQTIKQKGLNFQVTPTSTVIEGDMNQLMDVAKEIHNNALQQGVDRVITNITIDDRKDKQLNMSNQVNIVQQSLQ
jgi:uncharacterized protein (TIGR00106 family)